MVPTTELEHVLGLLDTVDLLSERLSDDDRVEVMIRMQEIEHTLPLARPARIVSLATQ